MSSTKRNLIKAQRLEKSICIDCGKSNISKVISKRCRKCEERFSFPGFKAKSLSGYVGNCKVQTQMITRKEYSYLPHNGVG